MRIKSVLQRILASLRRNTNQSHGFPLNSDLQEALRLMALREGRSEEDLTMDLITSGYAQQQISWELMRCWRSLTPRERQVVALICRDYSNQQIADHMVVSIETVRSHVHHSLRKFGVQNRRELSLLLAGWKFSDHFVSLKDN
jgi:DNA-binding CsgD family transcriptional regulator